MSGSGSERKYEYLPQVRDPGGKLRQALEQIRKQEGPDTTLADVMRLALREFIARRASRSPVPGNQGDGTVLPVLSQMFPDHTSFCDGTLAK
jgi:hypothetical protein